MVGGRSGEISKGPIVYSFWGKTFIFFCLKSNKELLKNLILDNYGQASIFKMISTPRTSCRKAGEVAERATGAAKVLQVRNEDFT